MSMPKIIGSDITREQSVTDIIQSVALEQTALSHVLNAEGKKIQAMLQVADITPAELVRVNDSVTDTVNAVSELESMLISKLKLFGGKLKPPPPIPFSFRKRDQTTLEGLSGAVFELRNSEDKVVETATSLRGLVTFKRQYPGTYTMKETIPPLGYHPNTTVYTVVITDKNNITIDGTPSVDFTVLNVPYPTLNVLKVGDLDQPLAGAEFGLVNGEYSLKTTSGIDGKSAFKNVMPGSYELSETKAPSKFRRDPALHDVVVTAGGTLSIDGVETDTITEKNKELMDLGVTVNFFDSEDLYKHRPETVVVNLYQNGTFLEKYDVYTGLTTYLLIHMLEKYDDSGNLYVYTVDQDAIPYYATDVSGYTITNILNGFDATGNVIWDDKNNSQGLRPANVTIRLLKDGVEVANQVVSAAQDMQYTFTNLLLGGNYSVVEDQVSSYVTTYSGWDITNRIQLVAR